MTTALLIIDVQKAIIAGKASAQRMPELEAALDETVFRLQALKQKAHQAKIPVFLIQHDGAKGHRLEKDTAGWELRPEIAVTGNDILVHKKYSDSFLETELADRLKDHGVTHLITGGCMTQFCVDTTVRRAISLGYDVTLLADGHMTGDSDTLLYTDIMKHHNETLNGFGTDAASVAVKPSAEISF